MVLYSIIPHGSYHALAGMKKEKSLWMGGVVPAMTVKQMRVFEDNWKILLFLHKNICCGYSLESHC